MPGLPSLMWPHSRVCQVVLALHWSASVPTHRVSHPLVSYTRLQSLVLSGFQMAKVEATRSYKTRLWNSHYVTFATFCWSKSVTRPSQMQRGWRDRLLFFMEVAKKYVDSGRCESLGDISILLSHSCHFLQDNIPLASLPIMPTTSL